MQPLAATTTRALRSHTAAQAMIASPKVTKTRSRARRKRADPWAPRRKPTDTNPKPRAPPATHFTCRICIEEQPIKQFPKWIPPNGRGTLNFPDTCVDHLARNPRRKSIDPVCHTCIGRNMAARLDQVGALRVGTGCVELGCGSQWSFGLIMKYLPVSALERYNLEMFEVWRNDGATNLFTCLSPHCDAVGLLDTSAPGYPQVVCNRCARRACAQCLVPWHKDFTCAEQAAQHIVDQMTDPEKDTLKLMQTRGGKRCPNCFLVIEKDGGCDSMFCTGCQKFFNWATAGELVPIYIKGAKES